MLEKPINGLRDIWICTRYYLDTLIPALLFAAVHKQISWKSPITACTVSGCLGHLYPSNLLHH